VSGHRVEGMAQLLEYPGEFVGAGNHQPWAVETGRFVLEVFVAKCIRLERYSGSVLEPIVIEI
jgi:hypothetical protein